MKKYEIMAIIANNLKAKEAEDYAKAGIDKRIQDLGGTMTFQDFWGEKGFAYKIQGEKWGYYYVAQYEIDPEKINELRNDLNIDQKIARFLITTVEKNMGVAKTLKEIQSSHAEKAEEEKIKEAEADVKKAAKKEAAKLVVAKEEAKEEAKTAPKKKALKKDDVDKKLDQIIEDSTADL